MITTTFFDNFNQKKIIKYRIYKKYVTQEKQLEIQSSSNIYKKFSEIEKCEIDELAIFYKEDLVKRKDEFKKHGNNKDIYQIYKIQEMKAQLEIYDKVLPAMNNTLQNLEQETKQLKESLRESVIKLSKFQESEQQLCLSTLDIQFDELQDKIRNSIFKSKFEEILYNCYSCQMQIIGTNIQTPCQHNYHQQCFEELIVKQSQDIQIQCLCRTKLSFKVLQNLSDEDKFKQIQKQLFSNQLKIIREQLKEKYQIGEYKDEDYSYFYIIKNNNLIEQ